MAPAALTDLVLPVNGPLVQYMLTSRRLLIDWSAGPADAPATDQGEIFSAAAATMVIPLRRGDALVGLLVLGPRQHDDPFTSPSRQMLRSLAPAVALVLENALLLRQHAERERLAALGKLAAVIIHEIKNPLGIIRVSSGTLKKRCRADDAGQELASFIEEEVDRMNRTIAQFLSFARPQPSSPAPVDLGDLVHRTTRRAEKELAEDGVSLELNLQDGCTVLADADQLTQVLLNLLINARQALAGRSDARVRVSIERGEDGVGTVVVADNGPGVDAEDPEQIFEPFFTTRRGGTGLGLAIARQLLVGQGGRIGVRSSDQGASFTVALPLAGQTAAEPSGQSRLRGEGV
jgi:signal transduction histidine kinase